MSASGQADLIIVGRIATLGGEEGFGWDQGLAIGSGRVLAIGAKAELESLRGPKTVAWDLGDDQLVLPGITDAHLHLMNVVRAERQIDLTGTDLPAALKSIGARHREMVATGDRDGWLLGHGWALHDLGEWPDSEVLERVAPNRPVALFSHDHHSRWVSRRALELARIGMATSDPYGGLIRRDPTGRPSGILHESASVLVDHAIPSPTPVELAASLRRVAATLAALGITGVHDPGELAADTDIERGPLFYRRLAEADQLPLRVHASVRSRQLDSAIEAGLRTGEGSARYRMGWLKLFADGSLGSRSAALLEPYTDAAVNPPTGGPSGMVLTDAEELTELLSRAAAAGIVGQVHGIGDGAVRTALDVFSGLPRPSAPPMRRIEHAQMVDPADTARFGALGVAASVQPVHLRSDAQTAREAWGERAENTFPLKALIDGGALIPFGTDAPVEPADPWPGIAVAVARRDPFDDGEAPTGAHNAITLARAVRAACLDPQLVAGQSDLGRLTAGSRADLLVVPAAAFRDGGQQGLDARAFASIRPLATLIDGEIAFRDAAFDLPEM